MRPYTDCLLLTCAAFREEPHPDDLALLGELKTLGLCAGLVDWEQLDFEGQNFGSLLFRTPWNYTEKIKEFKNFVEACAQLRVPVWNPPSIIKQNIHKKYLLQLEKLGCSIVPTRLIRKGEPLNLYRLSEEFESETLVLKPAISVSSKGTYLLEMHAQSGRIAFDDVKQLNALRGAGDLLLQKFIPEISTHGEISLIFIDQKFTHSVLKKPAPRDFRVQGHLGGTAEKVPTPSRALRVAEKILECLDEAPLYARVDLIESGHQYLLMELELIEPQLWLNLEPKATSLLAYSISKSL